MGDIRCVVRIRRQSTSDLAESGGEPMEDVDSNTDLDVNLSGEDLENENVSSFKADMFTTSMSSSAGSSSTNANTGINTNTSSQLVRASTNHQAI